MTRAWTDLTDRGKERRLRLLALDLLAQYDMGVATCRLAVRSYNTVFRVTATDATSYALRVSPAFRIHLPRAEHVEAGWVSALARSGFPAPAVVSTVTGDVVSRAHRDDVDGQRSAVLFAWVPGRPLGGRVTETSLLRLGELMARLHQHPSARPAELPAVPSMSQVLYFDGPDVLDTVPETATFREAHELSQRIVDRTWADGSEARLLHGDIHLLNVMTYRGRLTLIDFQDVAWGLPVQDLSITTAALRYFERPRVRDADSAIAALRQGYEQVRPWPDLTPLAWSALEAARMLNVFNMSVGARPERRHDAAYIAKHASVQRNFLEKVRG